MTEPFKKPGTEWTKEQIAYISKLANKGLTASKIGLAVGLSRNTIIGALHRHGPEGWKKVRKRACRGNQTVVIVKQVGDTEAVKRLERRAFETGTKYAKKQEGSMWRLPESGMCKFIYGSCMDEKFELCGHKSLPNRPYCQTHHDFCHTKDNWLGGRPRKEIRNG